MTKGQILVEDLPIKCVLFLNWEVNIYRTKNCNYVINNKLNIKWLHTRKLKCGKDNTSFYTLIKTKKVHLVHSFQEYLCDVKGDCGCDDPAPMKNLQSAADRRGF